MGKIPATNLSLDRPLRVHNARFQMKGKLIRCGFKTESSDRHAGLCKVAAKSLAPLLRQYQWVFNKKQIASQTASADHQGQDFVASPGFTARNLKTHHTLEDLDRGCALQLPTKKHKNQ